MSHRDAPVNCHWFRLHGSQHGNLAARPQPYLVTLEIDPDECVDHQGAYPQARAVVDDFGRLIIVGGWR